MGDFSLVLSFIFIIYTELFVELEKEVGKLESYYDVP
jgi:hypothetical protein